MDGVLKVIFGILLAGLLFLVAFRVFPEVEYNGEKGIFNIVGKNTVSNISSTKDGRDEEIILEVQNTKAPEIKSTGVIAKVGVVHDVKSFISVKSAGSNVFCNGVDATDVSIIVSDIRDINGRSIQALNLEEGDMAEEVVEAAYYDYNACTVIFNQQGVYTIVFKVYGNNGRVTMSEIKIPVEVGG